MVLLAAILFGLAIGALLEFSAPTGRRLIPGLAVTVLALLAVIVLITHYPESGAGLVIPFASVAGMVLASGGAWKDHPLLSDLNYWERVVFITSNPRVIHDKRVIEEFEERVKQV